VPFSSTGMSPAACHNWQQCPLFEQTWATFKKKFTLAHQEFLDSQGP
jgi:hypothetical protein